MNPSEQTKALLNSQIDLKEYFLGKDPKKTAYYKSVTRRNSILNDFQDSSQTVHFLSHSSVIGIILRTYKRYSFFKTMRKIEQEMNSAIRYRRNFSKANTSVTCYREEIEVRLHGNLIGTVDTASNQLRIFDGGWQTVTTKSRLNALMDEFAPCMGVFQKNWDWFVSDRLTNQIVPFYSGMTV